MTSRPRAEVINDYGRDVANLFRILQRHYPQFLEVLRFQLTTRAELLRLTETNPDTLVLQFPYPRRTRLTDHDYRIMASLIHYGYAIGDFSEALIEIADLSPAEREIRLDGRKQAGPRTPRVLQYPQSDIIDRDELQPQIQDVYRILMQISEEPEA